MRGGGVSWRGSALLDSAYPRWPARFSRYAIRRACPCVLSGYAPASLKVDGGMIGNKLLMQFQADILNCPVVRGQVGETTALGAAFAAGLATGFWKSQEEARATWREATRWEPAMNAARRTKLLRKWNKAVQRSLAWEDKDEGEGE